MNMQHVVKVNGQVHEIKKANDAKLVLNQGKRYALADMHHRVMVHKHATTGRFQSVKIK